MVYTVPPVSALFWQLRREKRHSSSRLLSYFAFGSNPAHRKHHTGDKLLAAHGAYQHEMGGVALGKAPEEAMDYPGGLELMVTIFRTVAISRSRDLTIVLTKEVTLSFC